MTRSQRLLLPVAGFVLALAGCQAGDLASVLEASPALDVVVRASCPAGFRPLTDDRGCEPDVPAACANGTMPVLGATACQPVGPRTCPAGFEVDASGWGCRDVMPATPCTGATLEQLGSTACQPVGDCAATFPPAGATYFVNAAWTTAELDATHVRTVTEALQAAPAGATIAVYDGTYAERLRLLRPVTVVGRCAERVTIQGTGAALSGVRAPAGVDAEVRGLTFVGHQVGAYVDGGKLTLQDVVLQGNRDLGAWVSGQGSALTVRHSVIRDTVDSTGTTLGQGASVDLGARLELDHVALVNNRSLGVFAADVGTALVMTDCVLRDTKPDAMNESGMAVRLEPGASATVTRCALVGNLERGVELVGSSLSLVDSVVRDTRSNRPDLLSPAAIFAEAQAQVELRGSTLVDTVSHGVVAQGAGTQVTLVDSVVHHTTANARGQGAGVEVSQGAQARLEGTAVTDTPPVAVVVVGARASLKRSRVTGAQASATTAQATGMSIESGACVDVEDSVFDHHQGLGVLLYELAPDCQARIVGSLVQQQLPQADGARGRGLALQGGALTLGRVAVVSNLGIGLQVSRATSTLTLRDSVVSDTGFEAGGRFGYAVMAFPDTTLHLDAVDVRSSAGVGLAASGATVGVTGGRFTGNAIAVSVFDGSELAVSDQVPEPLAPRQVVVSSSTRFVGNTTKVGTGAVPVPDVFVPSR